MSQARTLLLTVRWAGHTRYMGPMEEGVQSDLRRLPDDLRQGGIAMAALYAARQLDGLDNAFDLPARDAAAFLAQLRHCLTELRALAPGQAEDDPTQDARDKRDKRLLHSVDSKYA